MESATRGRAKRRHLSASECVGLGRSSRGSHPLTQPFFISDGSNNLSRGLYPRASTKRGRGEQNEGRHQKDITAFFPVTGVVRVSPQKADMKVELGLDAAGAPEELGGSDYIPDELLEAVVDYTTISDNDRKSWRPGGVIPVMVDRGGAVGCSSLNSQHRPEPTDPPLWEVEEVDALPDTYYGLMGSSHGWAEPQGHMDDLPDEVLRVVLGHLSAEDIYRSVSLVCQRWRVVVNDPLFLPWKKLYYRYEKRERRSVEEISSLLRENHMTGNDDLSVLNMVKYMSQFKHSTRVRLGEVLHCVRAHRLFAQAQACLKHRIPQLEEINGDSNVWSIVTLMMVLGDGVQDIMDLAAQLRRSSLSLYPGGVSEFLSCVALLLLAMRDSGINISSRWHYNIFYVLHLSENATQLIASSGDGTVESRVDFRVTHEQQRILSHDIQAGHVVKIMALAGTGKKTTLVMYAQQRPQLRFLYMAFNKSVALEASLKFPGNVDCRTVHSMAFGAVGKRYHIIKKLTSNLKPLAVSWVLPEGQGGYINAKVVTQTINAFFASTDTCVSIDHVPSKYKNTNGQMKQPDHTEKLRFASNAQDIWEKMRELKPTRELAYHMTCDGYLKLWQLQRPRLDRYDVVFIDEAQDCTPAILDIMLNQDCGKILVGDPHQQIYTFRGAINALNTVPQTHLYYLTKSFRFGPEIAYVGATILNVCKKVQKILVGGSQEGSVRGEKESVDTNPELGGLAPTGQSQGTVAFLSRCNVTMFDEAVKLTEPPARRKLHIVGGVDNFGLKTILDIWKLMQPKEEQEKNNLAISDQFIRNFCRQTMGGYAGLRKYALQTEDRELEAKLAVVEKYNHRIPELVDRISTWSESEAQRADVILGTVHKSKGLEFHSVIVSDDFIKVPCARHHLQRFSGFMGADVPDDEWNLLYVAVTRAKKRLVINKTIENILTLAGEYFLRTELTRTLIRDGQPPHCSIRECQNLIRETSPLTMCKMPIRYVDSAEEGGPLCVTCVEQRLGHTAYILDPPEQVKALPYTEESVELPINIGMLMALL